MEDISFVVTHFHSAADTDRGFRGSVSYCGKFATREEAEAYVAEGIRTVYMQYKKKGLGDLLRTQSSRNQYQVYSFGGDLFLWAIESVTDRREAA